MPKRILLIEDEPDIQAVASSALELTRGWQVEVAGSGLAGIEAARSRPPDAIVLDVMMPGMDGTETFRRLRETPETRPCPVVFMTAKVQTDERARLEAMGPEGVVAKPFDPLTLGDELARILGWDD